MTIEKFGVRASNPDCLIEIDGQSFAELICYQNLHTENLRSAVAALNLANPGGLDECLSGIQTSLQALTNTSAGALGDYLRVAQAQGLRFELVNGEKASGECGIH